MLGLVAGSLAGFTAIGVVGGAVRRSVRQRTRLVAELREAREQLEACARERTVDLRHATAELGRNEQRYRSLVEATTAIVWSTAASGEIESDQPAWSSFTGQTQDQIKGWGWLNAIHPKDRALTASAWSAAVATGSPWQLEHRLRRHDGEYRHMQARGVPIVGQGGKIVEWVGVHADITDPKRAQEALAASERFARSILDALTTHIAILDEKGRIVATNKAWREFGFANSARIEVGISANYLEVCDAASGPCGEEAVAVAAGIRAVIRGEQEQFSLEYPCHSPSEKRWFLARVTRFGGSGPVRVVVSHEDVTAAKVANDERQKFVSLVEESADYIGMSRVAVTGEIIYLNRAAYELVGLDPDERADATRIADFHTDLGNRTLKEVALPSVTATGRWTGEVQFRHSKTGQPIDTHAVVFSIPQPRGGGALCAAIVARDITLRKRQEEELRAKTAFLEAQTESCLDGLLVVNHQQTKILQNRQFADIWRIPKEVYDDSNDEATLRLVMSRVRDPEKFLARVMHLYAHPDETAREEIELKDGRVVDRYSTPVKGSDGRYYGRIWAFRDITESKRQEAELRRSRAQLIDAIESLDAGLVMYGPDERLVLCNTKYKEMYAACAHAMVPGTPYEHILRVFADNSVPDLMGLSPDEWVARRLAAHRNPGEPSLQRLAGRWVRIGDHRTSDGSVVSLRTDITALKEAQEAAEAANRSKSEFLANMSHEIRTPMNGILGMTELTLDSELTREQRENLGMVRSSAESLLQVIDDILDFSKIEAGKLKIDPVPFALRDTLEFTVKALGLRARAKGLELVCHIDARVPDGLIGDALRIRQVVTNLVGNAIKFTEWGEVVIRVDLDGESADSVGVHVTVRDTGIGIPAEKHQAIFAAFAQADSSTTRRYGGTGLGLAITSQLLELMGGRIWVESEVGKGSAFHFKVRFLKQPGAAPKRQTGRPELERLAVLIVDDNAANRAMLEEVLGNWRMRPVAVADGASALAAMKSAAVAGDPFPLVLLDASMPEPDGFALAAEIKADPELAGASIMMLCSVDPGGDALRCRELGVAFHLRKPVAQSELFDAILTAMTAAPVEQESPPGSTPLSAVEATAPAQAAPGRRSLRVLLVEDNEVNQSLAIKVLQKRGHTVVVACDGRQAVALHERHSPDLILMDIQMPEMDGFAATAAIREREKLTGGHVPIVALTAHAMKGDRDRCLAAGMDAYLSKPLRANELFQAMARVVPVDAGHAKEAPAGNRPVKADGRPAESVFDSAAALAHFEGDWESLQEVIGLFATQAGKLLPAIRRAAECRDGDGLERFAHKLKGSLASLGAHRASAAALALEVMGRDETFAGVDKALDDLEQEMARLSDAMTTFTGHDSAKTA
jgi:PAS domain S-box-containing protein